MRDSRTRTSANSAATKNPFKTIKTSAAKRFSEEKAGSSKARGPRRKSPDVSAYCGLY
jgi:hypothetical protein